MVIKQVLIETSWNVKKITHGDIEDEDIVLIETSWNVKLKPLPEKNTTEKY